MCVTSSAVQRTLITKEQYLTKLTHRSPAGCFLEPPFALSSEPSDPDALSPSSLLLLLPPADYGAAATPTHGGFAEPTREERYYWRRCRKAFLWFKTDEMLDEVFPVRCRTGPSTAHTHTPLPCRPHPLVILQQGSRPPLLLGNATPPLAFQPGSAS